LAIFFTITVICYFGLFLGWAAFWATFRQSRRVAQARTLKNIGVKKSKFGVTDFDRGTEKLFDADGSVDKPESTKDIFSRHH
jgi:hypothetical protein